MRIVGKSSLLYALAAGGAMLVAPGHQAAAQPMYSSIVAFGDSYVDNGYLVNRAIQAVAQSRGQSLGDIALHFGLLGALGDTIANFPTGRMSGGTNYIDTTSQLLGVPQRNFGIGGAQAGTSNTFPGLPGFAQEWQGFLASREKIAPSDLVMVNIGGNDARGYYLNGGSLADVPRWSTVSANQAMAGINALVAAGARNLVYTGGDVGMLPEAAGHPATAPIGSAFSRSYNAQIAAALAPIARSGVRVEYVDLSAIIALVKANPARYGFANVGACPTACIGNPELQSKYFFYFDGIHPTSLGFEIMGKYVVNRLQAPLALPAQADLGVSSAIGFASTLFGRLDGFRESSLLSTAMNSYAMATKAPHAKAPVSPPANPWSFYMVGNGASGDRRATAASNGYNLDSVGGTIGAEYRINANAFVGTAFDYSNPKARFFNSAGTTKANTFQIGGYGAWANAHFFAQALATYGWQNYRNSRLGVVDTITSAPDGTSFVAAGKTGYLFDVGKSQVGPIGGLIYARAKVHAYSESGDPVLTLAVGQQSAEALIGSVGAQFRFPVVVDGWVISPYVNLTADEDLIGNGRIIQFGATSAPLIVNRWTVPSTNSQHVYGRVAAGVVAPISDNVALTANVSQTFARQGGNDFYGNGGLKISF